MTLIRSPYHLEEPIPALADGDIAAASLAEIFERVASRVRVAALPPVVFSADCTTALGTVAGLQRAGLDPAIVWLDAHGDLNTPETSQSSYLGGMVLAAFDWSYGPRWPVLRPRPAPGCRPAHSARGRPRS
ncbi:arginase family protein [Fodinicola feengrottensis]|uniref:arginase family protein n=1 Tax=Fodinicola feengrottensis TaxID=435914 RepID=UPI0013D66014|nr:arginase family protein [Fodinicola feengrottensis]